MSHNDKTVSDFLEGKSQLTQALFQHFTDEFMTVGMITLHPAKTMIGIANGTKRIAWVTQLGKNFVHIVFPFTQPYTDNLCFMKIAPVPGDKTQFNHHFRMYAPEDVNDEVKAFMKLAFTNEEQSGREG